MGQGQEGVVTALGQPGEQRPAGIVEPQHPRGLVEGLTRRVVHGLPQQGIVAVGIHAGKVAVPAADHQAQERRLQVRRGQEIGADMSFDMVDGDERQARGIAQPLHAVDAGEQRAHQPRPVGHGQCVHVRKGHARFLKRPVDHPITGIHVRPAGDFRHHTAVERMGIDLGKDDAADDVPSVFHNGGGGLVAAGFHGQDTNGSLALQGFQFFFHLALRLHGKGPP